MFQQFTKFSILKIFSYLFCAFLASLFLDVLVDAFLVTFEADGEGDGVVMGSGSGSSSSGAVGGSNAASDFDDDGTGLGTETEVLGCSAGGTGNTGGGGVKACACCAATRSGFSRGFRVDVPLRTSHIAHLNASGLFLKVQTLQSQAPSFSLSVL